MKYKNEAVTVTSAAGDVKVEGLKTWLCSGTFDDSMLRGFTTFYEGLLKDGAHEAIIYIDSSGGFVQTRSCP